MRRRDLTAALMGALGGDEPVVFDQTLDDLEFDNNLDVTVARVTTPAGRNQISADLFVSAEGVNSRRSFR